MAAESGKSGSVVCDCVRESGDGSAAQPITDFPSHGKLLLRGSDAAVRVVR